MASLQELHELIHSLSSSEKRQVKQYINALSGKARERYVIDFQCFEKIHPFDKDTLKSTLLDQHQSGNLSKSNTNLYNFICDVLVTIRQNKHKGISFLKQIQVTEMLLSKGLIDQAMKANELTLAQCDSSGFDRIKPYLLFMRDNIEYHIRRNKGSFERMLQNYDEQLQTLVELHTKVKILRLKGDLKYLGYTYGTPRNQEELDRYLQICNDPLFAQEVREIPLISKHPYYALKTNLYVLTFQLEKAAETNLEALEVIRSSYDKKKFPIPEFWLTLMRLELMVLAENYEEVKYWSEELLKLREFINEEGKQAIITTKICWAWLYYYLRVNDIKNGMRFMAENMDSIFDSEIKKLNALQYITYLICARICFLAEEYHESLRFLNILLNQRTAVRSTLLPHIDCLNILIHYRLGNHKYLPYAVRALYRSLKSSGRMFEPERELINFFRRATKTKNIRSELQHLYERFKELEKDKFNMPFFGMADYLLWLEKEIKLHD